MEKLKIIDIYRGLFAFLVMIYHFFSWLEYPKNELLSFLSVYGVESFFVISGIVLTYVYRDKKFKKKDFFKKRFLRIAPLFYFLLIVEIVFKTISNESSFYFLLQLFFGDILFLNILRPDLTNIVSGWSVMNEMGFYLLFPFLMILKDKCIYLLSIVLYIVVFYVYNEYIFTLDGSMVSQNYFYVSAIFHLPFFVFGIVIGMLRLKYKTFNFKTVYPLLLITLIIILFPFIFHNEKFHNSMMYIMNSYRIVSSILILLLMGVATFTLISSTNYITRLLEFLAKISYSLYLMHFIVFYALVNVLKIDNLLLLIFVSIITSLLTYELIENKLTQYVKKYVYK